MTNNVFKVDREFKVMDCNRSVTFEVNDDNGLDITADEEAGWDSQIVYLTMTEDEAKQLLAFLIEKGY